MYGGKVSYGQVKRGKGVVEDEVGQSHLRRMMQTLECPGPTLGIFLRHEWGAMRAFERGSDIVNFAF